MACIHYYTLWIPDPPNMQGENVIAESENHLPSKTVIVTTESDSSQPPNNLVLTPEMQVIHDVLFV